MNRIRIILNLLLVFFFTCPAYAQYGTLPPFTISLEAVIGNPLPGVHSYAFAQSGDKWLIIGGRTNGLHGINSNDGFPPESKNNNVIVIDTSTWSFYSASLDQLPLNISDPMRSTNMEYIQDGNYLYMIGGFGYDSIASMYVTFPKLTAVHIDNMIDAVINAQPIASHIRQVSDTNFAVCGGELGKLGSDYYLCFGHNFGGRYTDPPTPLFTQEYTEQIRKFNLTDDGTNITLSNFNYLTDTNNFHRRDLNVGPVVLPDGSFALEAYGGVFKKTENMPFREPITITPSGTNVNMAYQQVMSHYTCANIPIFDSLTGNMYSTFFGGISLYRYSHAINFAVPDSLIPFIDDITTMTTFANGIVEEAVLPVPLPDLLGSNAKFVLNKDVAHYSNEVIKLRDLSNTRILAGYMFGGIRAEQGNFGASAANDTVYRIYLTPNNSLVGMDETSIVENAIIFPNPALQSTTLMFNLSETQKVRISLSDITGKEIQLITEELMTKGKQQLNINISKIPAGIYVCSLQGAFGKKVLKLVVR
ncbi:MAG: hypothetical protein K0S44_349 [Bacteroidetes bacterium]|jgi:hypothetical protein|nr:hypothetical protein [Bacteroidota bacterium]